MSAGIYKLTSPSGKCYIGQSLNIEKRLLSYKRLACKNQGKIHNALLKYGWDNFKTEYLYIGNKDDENIRFTLNDLESRWIKEFDSIKNGYNIQEGGWFGFATQESRKKISNSRLGKPMSDETKRKISESTKGRSLSEIHKRRIGESNKGRPISEENKKRFIEYNTGRIWSEESRRKLGASLKNRIVSDETREKLRILNSGRKYSDESKLKMSNSAKGKIISDETKAKMSKYSKNRPIEHNKKMANSRKKAIIQYSKENVFIKEWDSAMDAGIELKIDSSGIIKSCKNKRPYCGGFMWKYKI